MAAIAGKLNQQLATVMVLVFWCLKYFATLFILTACSRQSGPAIASVNAPDSPPQAVQGRLFVADGALPWLFRWRVVLLPPLPSFLSIFLMKTNDRPEQGNQNRCPVLWSGPGADVLFIRTFVTLIIAFLNTDRVNPCGPELVRKYWLVRNREHYTCG